MLLSLARKLRVVPDVARRDLGWDALTVARIVVASGTTENRTILSQHAAMSDAALSARALAIRRWLQAPCGPIAGVWLVSTDAMSRGRASGDRR